MPAPLDSFIACQIVTLKKAGFSYQEIAEKLGLKAKSTAQSVFRRYNKKIIYQKIHWSSSKVIGKKPKKIGQRCSQRSQNNSGENSGSIQFLFDQRSNFENNCEKNIEKTWRF